MEEERSFACLGEMYTRNKSRRFTCRYGSFIFLFFFVFAHHARAQYILLDTDVEVVDGVLQSCSYHFEKRDIVIPDTLDGQQIIGIGGPGVFQSKGIRTLQLPAAVRSIGKNAFLGNLLTEIDFRNCNSLVDIGEGAFGANQLSGLDLDSCTALHSIGEVAFGLNELRDVRLPGNLRIIGNYAFRHNKLSSIDLGPCKDLNFIGMGAFTENDSLGGFLLPENNINPASGWKDREGNTHIGGTFVSDLSSYFRHLPYILTEADVKISNGTILSYNKGYLFREIVIPDTLFGLAVRGIAEGVFHQYSLSRLTLPATLQKIGDHAFRYNGLQEVDFSACTSLVSIGASAFQRNEFSTLDLDACTSLVSIGYGAFNDNPSLEGFRLPVHEEFGALGWKDDAENLYAGDSMVSDLVSSYYIPMTYTLTDEDVVMVEGVMQSLDLNSDQKDIIIPDTLDGQAVREIGPMLFYQRALTHITLPSTLKIICSKAFYSNSLNEIVLPEALEVIGSYAFAFNGLTMVDLSMCNALYSIGSYAFYGNASLGNMSLPVHASLSDYGWKDGKGNLFSGGQQVYDFTSAYGIPAPYTLTDDDVVVEGGEIQSCSYNFYFREIFIPDTLDGQLVKAIADGYDMDNAGIFSVFADRGITGIALPGSLQRIGHYAFWNNGLSQLDLQGCSELESVGSYAFYSNCLTDVRLPSSLKTIKENSFAKNSLEQIDITGCASLVSIGSSVFAGNTLECFVLPENAAHGDLGWLSSDGSSYKGGDSVRTLYASFAVPAPYTLMDTDVEVENGIILSCTDHLPYLSIVIPDTLNGQIVTGIANEWEVEITKPAAPNRGVFYSKGLIRVVVPTTLETIGSYAFSANQLTDIDLSTCTALAAIGENAFSKNRLTGFVLPANDALAPYSWEDADGNSYEGGDTVRELKSFYRIPAPYTFSDTDVEVSEGIIQSCSYNFALWDISIPDTLDGQAVIGIAHRDSGLGVFNGKRINRLSLPSTLEFIGDYTFLMGQIQDIDLSKCTSLVSIGKGAFQYLSGLDSLDLRECKSLTSIGDDGFANVYSLISANFSGCSLATIGRKAFSSCRLDTLDLSGCKALQSLGEEAFSWNGIDHLTLDSCQSLDSIGDYAFAMNNLKNMDLRGCSRLTYIGYGAFGSDGIWLHLPLPEIPGKEFRYWTDGHNKYDALDSVQLLDRYNPASYSAIFSLICYDVTITVTDGTNPVQGAMVSLQGFDSVDTDFNGMAVFMDLLPQNDLTYMVQAPGFESLTGTVSIVDDHIEIQVTLQKITGDPVAHGDHFKLFPNPCREIITIESDQPGIESILISSVNGQVIYKSIWMGHTMNVNLSTLKSGVYLITVQSKDFSITRKILKLE